ncbi:MAG TPA: MBOAT family protein [Planctomycetaceae bacterium]|nr:MBOAT family protein [Planctomycetaceae bacterium]
MLFHTWTFALFFLVFYGGFLLLKGTRFRLPWLLAASYLFYGWWNPLYLLLILWSTTVDYLAVIAMSRSARRKPWLALSVCNNLGMLGFFKYGQFVTDNINSILARLDLPFELVSPGVLLPVGISFYVFQSMSYTIDFYRGNVQREPNFIRYATFVSLFPQLVAGPIERAKNLLPQLQREPRVGWGDVADGMSLFVVGLFKKAAMADCLALYVDPIYADPGRYQAPALLLATFAFGWQIYFDFSGYTDMARGIGRMIGVQLMLNFDNPYLATGLRDFWRRWHISLSSWFRDYVYIPLGGGRHGTWNTYRNICLTMVISGLWHGAAWNFVIWGALHAAGYCLTRALERSSFYCQHVPRCVKQAWTFLFVTFSWIFFRAETFNDAVTVVHNIFAFRWADPAFPLVILGAISAVWTYQFVFQSGARWLLELPPVRVGIAVVLVLYTSMFAATSGQPFIYFQF